MPGYMPTINVYNSENKKDWDKANTHSTNKASVWMTSGTIDTIMREHEKAVTERKRTKKDDIVVVVSEYQCA